MGDNIRKWLYRRKKGHRSVGFMNGKINGVEVSARGKDVPRIPDEYWLVR
jgi:hypothetical protein